MKLLFPLILIVLLGCLVWWALRILRRSAAKRLAPAYRDISGQAGHTGGSSQRSAGPRDR